MCLLLGTIKETKSKIAFTDNYLFDKSTKKSFSLFFNWLYFVIQQVELLTVRAQLSRHFSQWIIELLPCAFGLGLGAVAVTVPVMVATPEPVCGHQKWGISSNCKRSLTILVGLWDSCGSWWVFASQVSYSPDGCGGKKQKLRPWRSWEAMEPSVKGCLVPKPTEQESGSSCQEWVRPIPSAFWIVTGLLFVTGSVYYFHG